jgi:hypothetical protein
MSAVKLAPETRIVSPPAVVPARGSTAVTVGSAALSYEKPYVSFTAGSR